MQIAVSSPLENFQELNYHTVRFDRFPCEEPVYKAISDIIADMIARVIAALSVDLEANTPFKNITSIYVYMNKSIVRKYPKLSEVALP